MIYPQPFFHKDGLILCADGVQDIIGVKSDLHGIDDFFSVRMY